MEDIYTAIYEKLSTLQWLMKRRQMFSQAESGTFADSTRGQGRILAMLKIQPEIATKDLAYLLGIRQQLSGVPRLPVTGRIATIRRIFRQDYCRFSDGNRQKRGRGRNGRLDGQSTGTYG